MMSGVQVHLDSPLPEMRLLGMIVAEALAEKVDVSKQKLQFEVRHMSHFAYACKMRYPLKLVLEKSEYLWFY